METVFVGLSGGVDSAVSAALLKERGYNVVGAFIKIWQPEFLECTWKEDRLDAMRVCAALSIPFREIDLSEEYKREVVQTMIAQYSAGVTPNPDVLCNRSIKFGHFAAWAFANGADKIATGHYAQITESNGTFSLLRGKDPGKDQSYFLYRLGQSDLSKTIFPVGGIEKSEVRLLAQKFALPVAQKHDSQGLCFVGDVSMKDFLSRYISLKHGDVIDLKGAVIGRHDGAALYTIGERHGFTSVNDIQQFIVHIDIPHNLIQVSPNRTDAQSSMVGLSELHWIESVPDFARTLKAQARYRETSYEVSVGDKKDGAAEVRFKEPHIAAPGQSLVLYDGNTCLGGGIINTISRD